MHYQRNEQKNKELQKRYNISFEDIVEAIAYGKLIDIIPHYNPKRYPHQRLYILHMK